MTITVKNTCIEISNYNGEQIKLERSLSVWEGITHKYIPVGYHYDKERRILYLPKGLSISYLENLFECEARYEPSSDPSERCIYYLRTEPRAEQLDAINFLLSEGVKFNSLRGEHRYLLSMDTGKGKTYCTMAAISQMRTKSAILLKDKALVKQWVERIVEYTDIHESEMFCIAGSSTINKLFEMYETKGKLPYKVYLISHRTISKYCNKNGWHKLTELFKCLKIGVKVFDEAHLEFQNIVMVDMFTNTDKTFYLTATPEKSSAEENIVYNRVFNRIPTYVLTIEPDQAYINTVILKYFTKPTLNDMGSFQSIHGMNIPNYMKYLVFGGGRFAFYKTLMIIMKTIKDKEGKIAIMLGRIDATERVKSFLIEQFPEIEDQIGLYTSAISKKMKEEQLEKKFILTTTKSMGTGMDVKDLRYVVMFEPYSSKTTYKQVSGRLRNFGEEVFYFEAIDFGVKRCRNQFSGRQKLILSRSKDVKIFEITN